MVSFRSFLTKDAKKIISKATFSILLTSLALMFVDFSCLPTEDIVLMLAMLSHWAVGSRRF
jgi:hypothetical protein